MFPLFGLEVALVAMLAGIVMMPAKRRVGDQLVELQKVHADLQVQLTAIEQSDDYQKAASLLAADPLARLNKKKFSAAISHAYDTYVSLKNQLANVSANIAQLEMTMEQPALKVLVSDKSGRVMERPFKDLDFVSDSWVNKSGKEHKALKRENRELNQIYHALQKVNRNLEDERDARRDDAPPEQVEELEKATNDAITEDAFAASFWERAGTLVAPSHRELLAESQAFAASSRAASTKKVYANPWEGFKSWCRAGGYSYLPASPVVVGMFLTTVAKTASSYTTVKLASAAIFMQHDLACEGVNPTKHPFCKAVRAAAKRSLGTAVVNRKEPLTLELIVSVVRLLAFAGAPVWSVMMAAYTALCFAGFFRYDDAAGLLVRDVQFHATHAAVFIAKRKNDQFREGNVVCIARGEGVACPVGLMERYLKQSGLKADQPLFQGFNGQAARSGKAAALDGRAIGYAQARYHVLKAVAKVMGITHGEAQAMFGLHSLRSGGATAAAEQGVDERLFQAHGGWRSREAMLVYLADSVGTKLKVSKALGY